MEKLVVILGYIASVLHKSYVMDAHYENTPIQIYRKFHLQKLKFSE